MDMARRATWGLAALVFLFAAVIYFTTLAPTVPFWDAGEFIACSYILGIPHPPGTPLYVLLGRVATLIPWHTVAERINAMSAIPSALTVMITYLVGLKLIHLAQGKERDRTQEWIAHVGAAVGALMFAFSDNYWENAIEAEVYSMMSFAQILVFWLGLRWWEEHEQRPTVIPLLLCVYLMWLSVGLHLGVGVMGLPLILLVLLVDRRAAMVFSMPFLTVVLVTMGLERMAGGMIFLSTVIYWWYASQKKIETWVMLLCTVGAFIGLKVAFSDENFKTWTVIAASASIIAPLILLWRKTREAKIMALILLLMVVGYSTHLYLPIRAAQHPAINEGDPSHWDSLRDLLERKQYGPMNMFVRRAPLSVQLDKEFWRYFRRQWPLFPTHQPWNAALPLVLGLIGGFWQARRERISFLYTFCFLGLSTAGLIVFLNFSDHEVRERDYFFQSGYHAYSLWIGMGVACVIEWVRASFDAGRVRDIATVGTAVLLASQPVLLVKSLWFTHDRRGNYVAHDYAFNMLAPLAPNSFMFTNGDNDTFPLWYIQQVEGVRKDVRVVNLSLLNTDWYIRQLRDENPKVPIRLDDDQVRILGVGAVRDTAGNVIGTNEYMVHHIMSEDRTATGWKVQPYFAVTVPEHMGYEKNFTLEGLVYRVNTDTLHDAIDEQVTRRSLYQLFKYRGLFAANGSWDSTVFKDENAATLSRNNAAAHLQLAFLYRRRHDMTKAIDEMERVARMFPDYTEVLVPLGSFYMEKGDTARALALFRRLTETDPGNPEAHYYYGVTEMYRGNMMAALREFDGAIRADPGYAMAYYAAYYALTQSGQRERAMSYLERLAQVRPDDPQVQQLFEERRRASADSGHRLIDRPFMPGAP
jgi:Tfp pilus assembly protein PilF